jgi:hypothetical protein
VWAIQQDLNGDLIAVTKEEAHYSLSRFDGDRFHAERPRAAGGIKFGWSWSHIAVHSRSGDWWLGTGDGILVYRSHLSSAPDRLGRQNGASGWRERASLRRLPRRHPGQLSSRLWKRLVLQLWR